MLPKIIAELRKLQRERSVIIKSRMMQYNRLLSVVAGTLGYESDLPEKDREKLFKEAALVIRRVGSGEVEHAYQDLIKTSMTGIGGLEELEKSRAKAMEKLVQKLPVARWATERSQRGFGLLSLAQIIGETDDLARYHNPAKVWKRMGCAPHTFNGDTFMGATWKSGKEGKLPAEEWTNYGYSPRRRSLMYVIGENLVKLNGGGTDGDSSRGTEEVFVGPYRHRYDQAKALAAAKHPDWGKLRCHRHAMLLMVKLLLKNLWVEWHRAQGEVPPGSPWEGKALVAK